MADAANGYSKFLETFRAFWPVLLALLGVGLYFGSIEATSSQANITVMSQSERINAIRDKIGEMDVRLSVVQTEILAISRNQVRILNRLENRPPLGVIE